MPADRLIHRRVGHSSKVNALSSDEFRTWVQYLLSADDFGIMPLSAASVQSDNDYLETKASGKVYGWLVALVKIGLVLKFTHQRKDYIYQPDWQDYQRVRWPARTIHPAPPSEHMTPATRLLFEAYPGGKKVPLKASVSTSEVPPSSSERASEGLPPTRETAIANGSRLTANGQESDAERAIARARAAMAEPVPVVDGEWPVFRDAYPSTGRVAGRLGQEAFFEARRTGVTLAEMIEALENQKAGAQWAEGRIPNMLKWLSEGRWVQRHDPVGKSSKDAAWDAAMERAK